MVNKKPIPKPAAPRRNFLYVLAVLAVVGVLGYVAFSTRSRRQFTDAEALAICKEIAQQYAEFANNPNLKPKWEEFERDALPKLKQVADDYDANLGSESRKGQYLRQIAKNNLPTLIKQRGVIKGKLQAWSVYQKLQEIEFDEAIELDTQEMKQVRRSERTAKKQWDPVVVGILGFDVILVAAGIWYRFRR